MGHYSCVVDVPEEGLVGCEAKASIAEDCLELYFYKRCLPVPYADLMDMRLLNYHLHLALRGSKIVVSRLGFQTEEFFDKLWEAYAEKSLESLFVEGAPIVSCEGDYAYREPGLEKSSIARIDLYDESLCIVPHDVGARRVPLCFACEPARAGFSLALELDTGESYTLARLGSNTDPLFDRLCALRKRVSDAWVRAHKELDRDLDGRLGERKASYQSFRELGAEVVQGLFSSDDAAFWFAAVGEGRAAVELVCDENTATYLYRFSCGKERFVACLRHAMEAVKRHRRLIYIPDEELAKEPLFVMAQDRSSYVRFLRACNAGRVIHNANWLSNLREFFA